MNSWQRWLKAPKTHLLNRVFFQIHLWVGIAVGLYILMISVTGSAFVLENNLDRIFVPGNVTPTGEAPLEGDALDERIDEVYAGFEVFMVFPSANEERAVRVIMRQDGVVSTNYFNQYTGEDRGSSDPWQTEAYRWLINFHDDLLLGRDGRRLNGYGAGLFLVMMLSGLIIWWRGRQQWKQGFILTKKSPRGALWQIHSVFGLWSLFFMFAWGISGLRLVFPELFRGIVGNLGSVREAGDGDWMSFMVDIHFARFEGEWVPWTFGLISLLPALMFFTGFIVWWKRVVMKLLKTQSHQDA